MVDYPLKRIPIELWDKFGLKCMHTGRNRRGAILMLISKFCGGTLHLEPAPQQPATRKRKPKATADTPIPPTVAPEPIAPDLMDSF